MQVHARELDFAPSTYPIFRFTQCGTMCLNIVTYLLQPCHVRECESFSDTCLLMQSKGQNVSSMFSTLVLGSANTKTLGGSFEIGSAVAPSHPTPRSSMATSAIMMQSQSKLKRATGRALMPDRGGEYREAFRHGGWHSSSRIAYHSSQRDPSILTR